MKTEKGEPFIPSIAKKEEVSLEPNLYHAWTTCQQELENPKEKARGNYSSYAKLEDILRDCLPILNRYGFSLTQSTLLEGTQVWMVTSLHYENGEALTARIPIYGDYKDMMKFGGGLTYARRYCLCMLLGIEGEKDLDGDKITAKDYDELYNLYSQKGLSDASALAALKYYYDYLSFEEIDSFNFLRVKKMFENSKVKA